MYDYYTDNLPTAFDDFFILYKMYTITTPEQLQEIPFTYLQPEPTTGNLVYEF